jgi:hypothetical protein
MGTKIARAVTSKALHFFEEKENGSDTRHYNLNVSPMCEKSTSIEMYQFTYDFKAQLKICF